MVKATVTLPPDWAKDWERPWVCGAPHIKSLEWGWELTRERQIFYCASEDVRIIRDLPDNAELLFG